LAGYLRARGYTDICIFDSDAVEKGMDIDFSDEYRRLEFYREGLNNSSHKVWQEIKNVVKKINPDVVGMTAMTTKFGSVLKTAEVIKKDNPDLIIIVGGPHPTLLPEQTLKAKQIDFVIRGEGEETFYELIKTIDEKKEYREIKGLSYRVNEKIIHNSSREFINKLDEIPLPARDLLMNQDKYISEDMGVIMTSRGCPFNCTYCCHMWQRKVRNRSVDNVIEEIRLVKQNYGTRQFEFKDDSFTLNRERIIDLCEKMVLEKLKINWGCSTRVDLLDEELILKMKKAGCNIIKLGIETGSERILKETKKGVTFSQMRKAAGWLNKHNIVWSGYFMGGLPSETYEDIIKTYKFMKELNPYYAGLGMYNPFPGTELFNQGVKLGLLHSEVDLSHFFRVNAKNYFFVNSEKRVANIDKETFDKVVSFMIKEFNNHNKQLKNILRRGWARKKVYLGDFSLFVQDLRKAVKWVFGSV
jgi:radical SAM superfamily enzyme YgiQ (UPF0313 family)